MNPALALDRTVSVSSRLSSRFFIEESILSDKDLVVESRELIIQILQELEASGFESYWITEIRPVVDGYCNGISSYWSLSGYLELDLAVRGFLGINSLHEEQRVCVYFSFFSSPVSFALPAYGSSVYDFPRDTATGEDFSNHARSLSCAIVHEMLHGFGSR